MPPSIEFDSRRSPVLGTQGMVATSQPLAAAAGADVLRAGGNAADAAVATAAALNVTEPNMTGLGGDCFALFYDATNRQVSALNGSGRAPAGLDLDLLEREGFGEALPSDHAHTITVPGACAGWCDFLERHGRLAMSRVLAPAIELAESGFPVAPVTARLWDFGARTQLCNSPGGAELLIDGRAPRAGELFRNPGLARSLRCIAEEGADGFYGGRIGAAIAAVVQEFGGVLSEADLQAHESTFETPLCTTYHDLTVWECPPNGQGLAALMALNLLRGFDLHDQDPLGPDRLHLMIESMRLAFADCSWHVSDPAFGHIPTEEMLSESYAAERRKLIRMDVADTSPERGTPVASSDTVFLCTVDAQGNACAFINSNYRAFGTGIVPEGCGFSLQNRGHNFSLERGHPNALAPRKRPYHTIIPGMITRSSDGSLYGPFGVMGGFMQPQGHVQLVVGLADDGLDPQAALDRSRFRILDEAEGGSLVVEPGITSETRAELKRRGHELEGVEGLGRIQFGRGQLIRRDPNGVLWGGSDPRADGCAIPL
jgi:gamma-glutamyltranspeptidase/glutathione hydrolase